MAFESNLSFLMFYVVFGALGAQGGGLGPRTPLGDKTHLLLPFKNHLTTQPSTTMIYARAEAPWAQRLIPCGRLLGKRRVRRQ